MDSQNIKVAVDPVVFGYENGSLFILLIKQKYGPMKGKWVLPGGFVKDNEPLSVAVARELKEETNVTVDYLEQLFTFGDDVNRDPRGHIISIAYLGLANPKQLDIQANTDASDVNWFEINKLPQLPFDHNQIIKKGLERLQSKVHYKPIGFDLLGDEFVFSDLENLYRTILQKEIDRRNFRKKILSFGLLEETGELRKTGSGRPGAVYRFNKRKYSQLESSGFHFDIKFA
ncbi:NUDIX hydrolase [Roseivirga seohaensis]|uniref:NUDIX hydrolase n=1 Tax=Roseivirga seohaensis TaxID=1914963 RepID=A0A150XQ11_9BACT|nr:NUDIX domain-containing protein [Roseivirga seohaensis]KYG80820.1 NUDIX hydrolase [Roseivirga seohaensis]